MAAGARKRIGRQAAALTILLADSAPTEFRIFASGENRTSKGTYLFDEEAARDVMAAYEAHGADVMVDLEHLSVEDPRSSVNFDPDARGWCQLELRQGELWAVKVAWTPDGMARLNERRQRYISPVFAFDPETRRISAILNIAITALPATDNLEPLVAARRQKLAFGEGESPMTPEQFAAVAEALGLGADANVEDVIATITAMVKKITDAASGAEPAEGATDELPPADAPPAMMAAARIYTATHKLARLSGKADIGEVVGEVETWRTSHLEVEAERAKLAKERSTLESGERRRLVGELVKLGVEIPATAWADDDAKTPAKRLADEPIAELRARVAKLTAAKAGGRSPEPRAPASGGDGNELSPRELAMCAERKIDPVKYAATRAAIRARNSSKSTGA